MSPPLGFADDRSARTRMELRFSLGEAIGGHALTVDLFHPPPPTSTITARTYITRADRRPSLLERATRRTWPSRTATRGRRRSAGWAVSSTTATATPGIVTTGPAGSVRERTVPHCAERLADAGDTVLTFGPRTFGESEGGPRGHHDPDRVVADIGAAAGHLPTRDDIASPASCPASRSAR